MWSCVGATAHSQYPRERPNLRSKFEIMRNSSGGQVLDHVYFSKSCSCVTKQTQTDCRMQWCSAELAEKESSCYVYC